MFNMPSLITAAQEVINQHQLTPSDFTSSPSYSRTGGLAAPRTGTAHASKLVRDAVREKAVSLGLQLGATETAMLEEIYRALLLRYPEYAVPVQAHRVF
ncbi:hypothetical protein H7Y40_02085 [Pedobacter sp.]|nr:hypothetical protein [Candidatus Saccharibacteria bacterium]